MPARRISRKTTVTFAAALAVLITTASPGAANPGDLDPTFDGDGRVTTGLWEARGVAIQADGKIVAAGFEGGFTVALARYQPDGSLDPTFGSDGIVLTDFGSLGATFAVVIQEDGKIVTAGYVYVGNTSDFALGRYNIDGSLDHSFDGDGMVTTDFGGDDEARAVALQADGKIVAAGCTGARVCASANFALARYGADGSLDRTFDGDGKVTTDFGGAYDAARGVAIQADGKIVAAGVGFLSGTSNFAIARYGTDGSLDPTFDGDGKTTTDFGGAYDAARGVAIQQDGRIVAAGEAFISGSQLFALARYNPNGSLDPAFDGDGKVTSDFPGSNEAATALVIQRDGMIVAAGFAHTETVDFALARYKTDGSLDASFGGGDGKVTTDFSANLDEAYAVAIQADGKIVTAGCTACRDFYNSEFALARYKVCRRASSGRSSIPCR